MTALTPQPAQSPEPAAQIVPIGSRSVAEVKARRSRVIELMRGAMVEKIHYGKIPGTPKPTLYKPGAEVLLSMFNLGARPALTEDLSREDEIRYRVQIEIFDRVHGCSLCVGAGECSSSERKYKWRAPVCNEEFDEAAEDRRREIWIRDGRDSAKKIRQVRTEPSDIGNTILKMAAKRGLVAATLLALACSDVFNQDLGDLPEEWARHLVDADESEVIEEEPGEPKAAPQSSGETPAHLHVASVRVAKTGTNDKGDWKLYAIKFSDGKEAVTFSESIYESAKKFAASKAPVDREIEHDEKKNRDTIVMLKAA